MTPFVAEEAQRSTPEDPPPTLMITEVLGDLAPEAEVADSPEREREEKGQDQRQRTISVRMLGSRSSNCPKCLLSNKLKGWSRGCLESL